MNLFLEAIRQVSRLSGQTLSWRPNGAGIDGYLEVAVAGRKKPLTFPGVNRKLMNSGLLADIVQLQRQFPGLTLIAGKIPREIQLRLQDLQINYLDAAGNAYLNHPPLFLMIEGKEEYPEQVRPKRKLFTKTGIHIVFHLLSAPNPGRCTYREWQKALDVSLGSITHTMQSLEKAGFLLKKGKGNWLLHQKEDLLKLWIDAYGNTLKPELEIGRYRFADQQVQQDWQALLLPPGTVWGGEPAANLLTGYLKPAEWILYTPLQPPQFMPSLRLLPDKNGEVLIYQTFWNTDVTPAPKAHISPTLLVYADLILTGEARNLETAQKIYDGFLKDQL